MTYLCMWKKHINKSPTNFQDHQVKNILAPLRFSMCCYDLSLVLDPKWLIEKDLKSPRQTFRPIFKMFRLKMWVRLYSKDFFLRLNLVTYFDPTWQTKEAYRQGKLTNFKDVCVANMVSTVHKVFFYDFPDNLFFTINNISLQDLRSKMSLLEWSQCFCTTWPSDLEFLIQMFHNQKKRLHDLYTKWN